MKWQNSGKRELTLLTVSVSNDVIFCSKNLGGGVKKCRYEVLYCKTLQMKWQNSGKRELHY